MRTLLMLIVGATILPGGAASQADLARAFDIKPASMSKMTVRLIEAGLISREVGPKEARNNIPRLSAHG
ncbi:MAG TPA: MarR family transcriptional regulator [Aurantimonas coralicida]|uniref:MarR family transcriptional regulator n=2 Tax=root TaxID=1 RepID=A0A9C9TH53_9HYPH|nr:MarR family transcriptional regulator [Aurantimonas coralicida]HEU00859.1 MarR family transcriptional regulator [Aurantimonas coralicida]